MTLPKLGAETTFEKSETPARRFWRRLSRRPAAVVMFIVLALIVIIALAWPLLVTHDPTTQNLKNTLAQPSGEHWFGTDELGRDVYSRILAATEVTLRAGLIATFVAVVIGIPLGLVAGYARGWVDAILNTVNDAIMALPGLLFAMGAVAIFGPNLVVVMTVVGIITAPRFFRVSRAMAIWLREEQYVEASRSVGAPGSWIVMRHVLPNALSPLIVQISLTMGFSILIEAGLSFLGMGVQPPEASWGSMLQKSAQYATTNPVMAIVPGLMILITVLAFNTVGDAIRDSLGREDRSK